MALLSDLVRIVAAIEGLEEVSVGIFARHAREAGLISQGGRGKSAAKMSVSDAANLLIAVNGCSLAKEVPNKVKRIRELPADQANPATTIGIGGTGNNFGEDLERLIGCFYMKNGERWFGGPPGATEIRFFRPDLMVEIDMNAPVGSKRVEEKVSYGRDQLKYTQNISDRSDETVISHVTLRAIAEAL